MNPKSAASATLVPTIRSTSAPMICMPFQRLQPKRVIVRSSSARRRHDSTITRMNMRAVASPTVHTMIWRTRSKRKICAFSPSTTWAGRRSCRAVSSIKRPRNRTPVFSLFGMMMTALRGWLAGSPWKWKLSAFASVISLY